MVEEKLLGFERPGALARPKTFAVLALSPTPMGAAFTADRGGKIKAAHCYRIVVTSWHSVDL